jgi:yecA family protein
MTTSISQTTPLDDEQLDHLETLLDGPELKEALFLDEIQGYLCAALAGPQPFSMGECLIDILGSEVALESSVGQEAAGLIRRFAETLESDLATGIPPILLLYPKEGEESSSNDYRPWCQAYLAGVDQAKEDWFECLEKENRENEIDFLDEHLFPLMFLTGEAEAAAREHGENWPEGSEHAEIEQKCEEALPQVVTDIYRFWLTRRQS